MKKIFLSLTVIVAFIAYSLHQRFEDSDELRGSPESSITSVTNRRLGASSIPQVLQPASVQYRNGEYTGDVADAYYGNIQVKAIIIGGKIINVQFLQYPNDRRTSIEINRQALPYLEQEAIRVQTASVDTITGATQTSSGFRESLKSALDQAKI